MSIAPGSTIYGSKRPSAGIRRAHLLCSSHAPLRFLFSARGEKRRTAPARRETTMDRMIAVVDLSTGEVTERASTTLTLDLPPDFERATPHVTLDALSHG